MTNALSIEQAKILTISTAHLHPDTVAALEDLQGNIPQGPSVAVREEGYLLNSHLRTDSALEWHLQAARHPALADRHPDLVLISALARGLGAEWVCIDQDGVEYSDILPSYDGYEAVLPTGEGWKDALSTIGTNHLGNPAVIVDRATLEVIEAGQTPGLSDSPQP